LAGEDLFHLRENPIPPAGRIDERLELHDLRRLELQIRNHLQQRGKRLGGRLGWRALVGPARKVNHPAARHDRGVGAAVVAGHRLAAPQGHAVALLGTGGHRIGRHQRPGHRKRRDNRADRRADRRREPLTHLHAKQVSRPRRIGVDVQLHQFAEIRSGGLEDRLKVRQDLLDLLLGRTFTHQSSFHVERQELPRVDERKTLDHHRAGRAGRRVEGKVLDRRFGRRPRGRLGIGRPR